MGRFEGDVEALVAAGGEAGFDLHVVHLAGCAWAAVDAAVQDEAVVLAVNGVKSSILDYPRFPIVTR